MTIIPIKSKRKKLKLLIMQKAGLSLGFLAERQGFEPWVPVRVQRFSRQSRSTTPASFLGFAVAKVGLYFYSAKF